MSSGFISEAEIAERRRIRQEEWEKVRKPDQPEQCPEEEHDHRSLYERLQEQKQKRDLEYEEAHKLKNMIRGLDDDELDFLDLVDKTKIEIERRKCEEEEKEIQSFRSAVAVLQKDNIEERITSEIKSRPLSSNSSKPSSQVRLLAGAVVKKRAASISDEEHCKKKPHISVADAKPDSQNNAQTSASNDSSKNSKSEMSLKSENISSSNKEEKTSHLHVQSGLCGIGSLPGLGSYSDSDRSSDSDAERDSN